MALATVMCRRNSTTSPACVVSEAVVRESPLMILRLSANGSRAKRPNVSVARDEVDPVIGSADHDMVFEQPERKPSAPPRTRRCGGRREAGASAVAGHQVPQVKVRKETL